MAALRVRLCGALVALVAPLMAATSQCAPEVGVVAPRTAQEAGTPPTPKAAMTYMWHMQQPIYWPAPIPDAPWTYQKAADSIRLSPTQGGHPQQQLDAVFGKADRVADYQHYAADAIKAAVSAGAAGAGAQMSFGGDLIENLDSLAADGSRDGFAPGWNATYASFAASQRTAGGHPRLDLVLFTYHHMLLPLADAAAVAMDLAIQRLAQAETWGEAASGSRGLFPAEMAFSERAIPTLAAAGVEWVIVSNSHISRACAGYPFTVSGDNTTPPNKADQTNPAQPAASYYVQSVQRGCTTSNAAGLAYTPHRARHVDPVTGNATAVTVVPAAMAMSWEDGYECYSTDGMEAVLSLAAGATNTTSGGRPPLFVLAHDGDNAFGGGYSYYEQCVPQLAGQAQAQGIEPTTVQQYLEDFPVPDDDIVHVEDGAWINKDGDFGSPQLFGWNWPLASRAGGPGPGGFDVPSGWALNERNWAVITAAMAHVLAADAAETGGAGVDPARVWRTSASSTPAELAWHFFLPSVTSGYMYYGSSQDMPVKPALACNAAVAHAREALMRRRRRAGGAPDDVPPTVWTPQRLPWNPGGLGAGPLWGYRGVQFNDTDFAVWTFVADAGSGVASVRLMVRRDADGENPPGDVTNEVYDPAGVAGADAAAVGPWQAVDMTRRVFPKGNFYNESIELFVEPEEIADEWYAEVRGTPAGTLLDYYVEATDNAGNVKRTDIWHVWVGAAAPRHATRRKTSGP